MRQIGCLIELVKKQETVIRFEVSHAERRLSREPVSVSG